MGEYKSSYESWGNSNIRTDYEITTKGEKNEEIDRLIYNEFRKFTSSLSDIMFWATQQGPIKESLKKFKKLLGDCYIESPNEYHRCEYSEPWYIFYTKKGPLKVGWRKRVINLDWSGFPVKMSADELFPGEDVTKGNHYIHAWGFEKLEQYVGALLNETPITSSKE
mgnify:CR=1 FL=1